MKNRFWASRRARLGENSARATRRSRYCSSWRWRLWLHQGAKGPSGAPDRPILARAPALGRSRGVLGSRSPPLLEAVVFRLFGSRWRRPVFGLSPVAGQPEVLGANQRRRGPGTQVIDPWAVHLCSCGPSNAPTATPPWVLALSVQPPAKTLLDPSNLILRSRQVWSTRCRAIRQVGQVGWIGVSPGLWRRRWLFEPLPVCLIGMDCWLKADRWHVPQPCRRCQCTPSVQPDQAAILRQMPGNTLDTIISNFGAVTC